MEKEQVLKRIGELKADGLSYKAIADRMNADSIPTLSGRGKWQKGTICNLLKEYRGKGGEVLQLRMPEPSREPSPEDRVKRLQAAHEATLREVDRLTAENDKLRERVNSLNSELSMGKQKSKQQEISQMQQLVSAAVSPLLEKIERLESLLADTSISGDRPGKKRGLSLLGWNIVESGGYYRAFRTIDGKKHGVYIGKKYDAETARAKIEAKEKVVCGKQNKQNTEPSPAGETPDVDLAKLPKDELLKTLIFRHGNKGRFARIERVRADYPHDDFDPLLAMLAARYQIELHIGGAGGNLSAEEINGAYYDAEGDRYLSVSWYGEYR